MEILNLLPGIYDRFIEFILIFSRISALFSSFILFRRDYVTGRIIIALSAILSLYVLLLSTRQAVNLDIFSIQMLTNTMFEIFIGFIAGLILNIVFEVFIAFGQIVSVQIGISMASLFDPKFGNITSLTHFYMMMTAIVFLSLNGHLVIIKLLIDSFQSLPVNAFFAPTTLISAVLTYSSVIFVGSLMTSLTVIITILIVNISLAVMTKFAPQLNIFSIGINISLMIGLICIYLTFNMLISSQTELIEQCLTFLRHILARVQ